MKDNCGDLNFLWGPFCALYPPPLPLASFPTSRLLLLLLPLSPPSKHSLDNFDMVINKIQFDRQPDLTTSFPHIPNDYLVGPEGNCGGRVRARGSEYCVVG